MCCISCIAIPVFLWVWFNLIMPVISKVKAIFWPKEPKQETAEEIELKEKPVATDINTQETTTSNEDKKNS